LCCCVQTLSSLLSLSPSQTSHISTLSLHDALPICARSAHVERDQIFGRQQLDAVATRRHAARRSRQHGARGEALRFRDRRDAPVDRKSTRLNSSHEWISYAVFCLKKKTNHHHHSAT